MPARRRFGNSESDDNFTIVVDNQQQQQQQQQQQNQPFQQQQSIIPNQSINTTTNQFDEKEKYPKKTFVNQNWNLGITTLLQSTIGSALQSVTQSTKQQQQTITNGFNTLNPYRQETTTTTNSNNQNWNNNNTFERDWQPTTTTTEEDFINCDINIMAARDRTAEFSTAIRSLQGRNVIRAVNIKDARKAKQLQSYGEFMIIAKHIGKNIASTYSKLEKLTLLAKRKSLFDDRPMEVQELTYIIKGDLNSLNQQIARLQDVSKSQRKSTNGKHLLSHSSNMVLALQAKLANMSTDFKQILEVRTENLKHQKNRRDQFIQGGGGGAGLGLGSGSSGATLQNPNNNNNNSSRSNPQKFGNYPSGSLLLNEQQQQQNNSININMNDEKTPLFMNQSNPQQQQSRILNESTLYDYDQQQQQQQQQKQSQNQNQQQQQQQQMMLYHDESDRYVQERAETMQNIESTIVELGGIFQQLAHMVKEQEEMVERIDTNVQDAELNIDAAHGEILRYFQSVTKNRWLMIKIFGILIFFFIFFVIFLA